MYLLRKARERGHVLEGLAIALAQHRRGDRADQGLTHRGGCPRGIDGAAVDPGRCHGDA